MPCRPTTCARAPGTSQRWQDGGLDTPLLLATHEFGRSLDVFPFEFGAILADHALVSGSDPFDGLRVEPADLRRACEVQARSHLLHLREGYLETRGRSDALAVLIVESAPAFAALVTSVAHLDAVAAGDAAAAARHVERRLELTSGTAAAIVALVGVSEISSADAERLFPTVPRPGGTPRHLHRSLDARMMSIGVTIIGDGARLSGRGVVVRHDDVQRRTRGNRRECLRSARSAVSAFIVVAMLSGVQWDRARAGSPPRADRAGQRLRERHRPGERSRDRSHQPCPPGRVRRRRRRRHGPEPRWIWRYPRVRDQAVREPAAAESARRARTTAC